MPAVWADKDLLQMIEEEQQIIQGPSQPRVQVSSSLVYPEVGSSRRANPFLNLTTAPPQSDLPRNTATNFNTAPFSNDSQSKVA